MDRRVCGIVSRLRKSEFIVKIFFNLFIKDRQNENRTNESRWVAKMIGEVFYK